MSVVLPASGWEMIANVRRRATSSESGERDGDSAETAMSDMRLERLAGKTGLIKPHVVVAEAAGQSHIGSGRTAFQFDSSSAGTTLPGSEGRDGLDRVVRRRPYGNRLGHRP